MKSKGLALFVTLSASITAMTVMTAAALGLSGESGAPYAGSSVNQVWNALTANPYEELPSNVIHAADLYDAGVSLIERNALRTLNDRSDLLPPFKKLAHPNGLCFLGEWNIFSENPYSGLFRQGTRAYMIARASVALNETRWPTLRGMGFAGKIFPTQDRDEVVKTANFFLVDDLSGTMARHYTDVEMTNSPKLSFNLALLAHLAYAIELAKTFKKSDQSPLVRQVYEIAESHLYSGEKVAYPKWMKIKLSEGVVKSDAHDFRNELLEMTRDSKNDHQIHFDIDVSDSADEQRKEWQTIGQIVLKLPVASSACDHELHFHHPRWR